MRNSYYRQGQFLAGVRFGLGEERNQVRREHRRSYHPQEL